ncbi:MAG: PQQ-like beta-propeller repeat protein [Planctomycetaceae bacterium]|nr:PQQ-like beta-propeller repeat protein [Planctomycetaceae bacterium]
MKSCFAIVGLLVLLSNQVLAENWGHWRGPGGNGAAAEAQPPTEWSATKNIKWKLAIPGRGSGSPVVWGDKVFVVTAISEQADGNAVEPEARRSRFGGRGRGGALPKLEFVLLCVHRDSGELLWKRTATRATPHEGTHSTNGFASASPCTDGQHVYAHFGSRGLFCYSMDGELKWSRTDFEPMTTRATFGEGSSPTIADDKILVPYDHEGDSYLYALDKLTGKTVWQTERDEPTNWSTPLVVDFEGGKQVVVNGQNCARGYDLATGKELWRCGGQTQRPVASAVSLGDLVIVGSGFRGSYMGAFKLSGRGDLEGTDAVAWSISRDTPDIASPLLSNGRVYFHKAKLGVLSCLDAKTGEPKFTASRIPGINSTYASPVAAGGHVYLTGRSGTIVVIKDSDELQIVATNSLGEGVDATPAPIENELLVRGEKHLFCIAAE